MAVREFDGVDDVVTFPPPAIGGAQTIAALLYRASGTSGLHTVACLNDSSGNFANALLFDNNHPAQGNSNNDSLATATVGNPDAWTLVVSTMATQGASGPGSNPVPRLHVYKLNAGAWTHEYGDNSLLPAVGAPGGSFTVAAAGGINWNMPALVAVVGAWSVALTDAEVEGLVGSTQAWADTQTDHLEFLADFNQDVVGPVPDLSGKGLDSTSVTGTDVMTGNDPAWTFGATVNTGPPAELHSGSSAISGGGTIATTGQKSGKGASRIFGGGQAISTASKSTSGSSTLSGGGAVASTLSKAISGSSSVTGGGSVITTGGLLRLGSSSVTGGGLIASSGSKRTSAASTVTGGGAIVTQAVPMSIGSGSSLVSGGGAVQTTGHKASTSSSATSGNGSIASTGQKAAISTSAVTGSGSGSASGRKVAEKASMVSGGGSVTSTGAFGQTVAHGASSVSGGGLVASLGSKATSGLSRASGKGQVTSTGAKGAIGASLVSGGGQVSATGSSALPPARLELALRPLGRLDVRVRSKASLTLDIRPRAVLTISTK